MNERDDFPELDNVLSEELADRLLSAPGEEIDASLTEVATLLEAARQPATAEELATLPSVVAAFQQALVDDQDPKPKARKPAHAHGATRKIVIIFGAATMASVGAAAAATGRLPNPFSSAPASTVIDRPANFDSNRLGPRTTTQPGIVLQDSLVPLPDDVAEGAHDPAAHGVDVSLIGSDAAADEVNPASTIGEIDTTPISPPAPLDFTVPGESVVEPGQSSTTPEQSDATPGPGRAGTDPGTTPGQSGTDPGTTPGQSGTTPGQSGTTPGQSGTTPGQSGTTPGQPGTTPGQAGTTPGQSGTTPGQAGTTPGQSGTTPGQSGTTPSQSGTEPGPSGGPATLDVGAPAETSAPTGSSSASSAPPYSGQPHDPPRPTGGHEPAPGRP